MITFNVYRKTPGHDAEAVIKDAERGPAQVAIFNASALPLEEIPDLLGHAALHGKYEDDTWIIRSHGEPDPTPALLQPDGTGLDYGVKIDAGHDESPVQVYIAYFGENSTTSVECGGLWTRSTFPVHGICADWGADDRLIGFALLGDLAEIFMRNGLDAVFMHATDDDYFDTIETYYEEDGVRKKRPLSRSERRMATSLVNDVAEKAIAVWIR